MEMVADNLAKCKEHIACIMIQIITLDYDSKFCSIFPTYVYKTMSFVSPEVEEKRMVMEIQEHFTFFNKRFISGIQEVTLNFLSENHFIGGIRVNSDIGNKAIEKLFMYVCTAERDCFINSARMITCSDLKYFEFHVSEPKIAREKATEFRNRILLLLDHLAYGGFDQTGVLVKPIEDRPNKSNPGIGIRKSGSNIPGFESFGGDKKVGIDHQKSHKNIGGLGSENSTSIFTILNKLLDDMNLLLDKGETFKISLTRFNVPLLIISLLDY